MKLLHIIADKPMKLKPIFDGYWILMEDYKASLVTDEGTLHAYFKAQWITDKRSGSDIINPIVPKWLDTNYKYQASIAIHDLSYSGHISKDLADDLCIRQGFVKSGEVGQIRAGLAYVAVQVAGGAGYYNMDEDLPHPYNFNRSYERVEWSHK